MYKFNGRPDGLGNRIEELIFLKTAHPSEPIEYFWNNINYRNDREYSIDFEMDGVHFINKRVEQNTKIDINFDQERILNASKTIKPKFEILFEETPIALHIRRGDKCHHHDKSECKMTLELSNKCIQHSIEILKNQEKPVFICSDDIKVKLDIKNYLKDSVKFIEPNVNNKEISDEYKDFFALTKCSKIYMCSIFSSYAITASMIGNIPLVTYFPEDKSPINRYKPILEYNIIN